MLGKKTQNLGIGYSKRFTRHFLKKTALCFCFLPIFLFVDCNKEPNSVKPRDKGLAPITRGKTLTIFLVDVSGSFNRIQKEGRFEGQNYFDIACLQIMRYIGNNADKGYEDIIIRQISNNSFPEAAFVHRLNLVAEPYSERKPNSPFRIKGWLERKEKYERKLENLLIKRINSTLEKIKNFQLLKSGYYSKQTDVLYAIVCCKKRIDNNPSYSSYIKKIIVYSDFKDTISNLNREPILLEDVEFEGRFVSKRGHTSRSYDELLQKWRNILRCKSITFKTPEESL